MKVSIILSMIILCSCSNYEGKKDSLSYDRIELSFHGNTGVYDTDGKIRMSIIDTVQIENLNALKNESSIVLSSGLHGTDYIINLLYIDSETENELLVRIIKNFDLEPVIIYGLGTIFDMSYRNDELVAYVASIIKLDAIKQYEGELTQEEFDKLLLGDE